MEVPPPTWCPACRFQRRSAWRNERSFFRNECKRCSKKVISVYPPDSGITVYCRPCWWSDDWDGLEYGIDFDPKKPFLSQLKELLYQVPLPDLFGLYTTLENSEYTNMVGDLKNCYFLTMADWDENCAYGSNVYQSKDSYDTLMLYHGELCYETVNCHQCYKTAFSVDCESCQNVTFSKNCVGCSDCIGCVNLKNKQYYIFNKPYSKEDYLKEAEKYQTTSRNHIEEISEKAKSFWNSYPQKYMHERLTSNVGGDYIYNSKNVKDSFIVEEMEDARYCALVLPGKTTDCYDHTHYGISADQMCETLQVGNQASRIIASWFVITNVENIAYSIFTIGSKNSFGCVGVKKREHCILNREYSKEEFKKLKEQIIEQMNTNPYRDLKGRIYRYGEFFPPEMSPFAYNVSSAQETFPLSEKEALEQGFKWRAKEKPAHSITIPAEKIPAGAESIDNSILSETIECFHRGKCNHQCATAFKLTSPELDFYKRLKLPIPNLCPNCRHYKRVEKRNPLRSWHRKCMCDYKIFKNTQKHSHHPEEQCPNEFETSYAPDRKEIVYCEACYQQEVS